MSTANSATDDDSVWLERIDATATGNVEDTKLVWDDEDNVLRSQAGSAVVEKQIRAVTAAGEVELTVVLGETVPMRTGFALRSVQSNIRNDRKTPC